MAHATTIDADTLTGAVVETGRIRGIINQMWLEHLAPLTGPSNIAVTATVVECALGLATSGADTMDLQYSGRCDWAKLARGRIDATKHENRAGQDPGKGIVLYKLLNE